MACIYLLSIRFPVQWGMRILKVNGLSISLVTRGAIEVNGIHFSLVNYNKPSEWCIRNQINRLNISLLQKGSQWNRGVLLTGACKDSRGNGGRLKIDG